MSQTAEIHQEVLLDATPAQVYEALTDAGRFSAMSGGAPAEIDATEGGAFSCFGGMIQGRNIQCLPGERLVQAWRAKTWASGVFSVVRFELNQQGEQTKVILRHAGFPDGQGQHLAEGWHANYWTPLAKMLGTG